MVEGCYQGKSNVLGQKPVTVSLCPAHFPHRVVWDRTRVCAVTGRMAAVESVVKECLACINGHTATAQSGFVLCLIGHKPVRGELGVTGLMDRCEQVGRSLSVVLRQLMAPLSER